MDRESRVCSVRTAAGKGAAAIAAWIAAGGLVTGWKAGGISLALSRAVVGALLGCVVGALVGLIGHSIAGSSKGAVRGVFFGFLLGCAGSLLVAFALPFVEPEEVNRVMLVSAVIGGIAGTVTGAYIERCVRPKTGTLTTSNASEPASFTSNDAEAQK